jgi:thioesterase domain-containing protein
VAAEEKVSWVVINARGDKRPIFWITPDASQGELFRRLGREQPIYCLRAPKSLADSPPLTLRQLAQRYVSSIRTIQPNEPYQLAGYCIAAVVAREIALELTRTGAAVTQVIMVDPPDPAKSKAPFPPESPLSRITVAFGRITFHLRRLAGLSWCEKIAYVRTSARAVLGRINYAISQREHEKALTSDRPLPDRFNGGYHAAVAAFLNSVPAIYDGAVSLIRPKLVPAGALTGANRRWATLLAPSVEISVVAGDSMTMWSEPYVAELAASIQHHLSSN